MSREGAMIAARDRARRLNAALGQGATVLMGCALVVLDDPPRQAAAAPAAASPANDATAGGAARAGSERAR